jgi:glutamate dehydrogenase/leucine dehydrogenase
MSNEKNSDFAKYLSAVELIEKVLKPHPTIIKNLKTPYRFIRSGIWLHRDDGSFEYLPAYRCQFNKARGMPQGGTRYEITAVEDTCKFLAGDMILKNAIVGIMHGGGKGVITVDKFKHSKLECELFSRGYIDVTEPYIGPRVDGPAPDKNTGGDEMSWFLDELELIRGYHCPGSFTGKPLVLGGSVGRGDATGLGAVYATKSMIGHLGLEGQHLTFGVDGFGNAGDNYIKKMESSEHGGHVCVATSDTSGIIAKKGGLDIKALHDFCYDPVTGKKVRKVTEFVQVDPSILVGREAIDVYLNADFGAPAASQNRIADKEIWKQREDGLEYLEAVDAHKIMWKFGVELANGPCTMEAIEILVERKIPFVPDIFASGGGVRVSSAEKAQGLLNAKWTEEQVRVWLKDQMELAFKEIMKTQEKYGLATIRDAATIYAGEQIVEAMKFRGGLYLPYGKTIDAMPVVVSATPHAPAVLLKQAWVVLTNLDKLDTLLLRSVRRWLRPILAH